ncbi:MAG: MATE family efflux transporter [Eubacteriales bacterium]|nr:MATE family efflux transporter [Eubacteriales bacterium]
MRVKESSIETKQYLFSNKDLRRLIIPLFIEQFLAIFVGLADSIMVASVGETAVSAVSLIDTIMILLINIFTALATGGAIVAGQALGRRKQEEGCEAVEQTLLFSTVFSFVIMVLVYVGKWFILHVVFGQIEPEVMSNCNIYLLIVTASIPFLAIYNSGAAMYRAMGDSKTPMVMSLAMNGMNLLGNAILLYGLGFGVEGAAIPTMLSRVFAGIWMLFRIRDKSKTLHVRTLLGIRLKWKVLKKILHLGIPYSLENSMFQLGKILVLSLVSGFGTASIAANAVANSVCSFAILGGMSMGYALSAVSAQCVGAGDYGQVRYYTKKLLKFSYGGVVLMNLIIILTLSFIIHIYNLSPETGEMARRIITYHAVCAVLIWPPAFTLPNTLRAANDVGFCMWLSIASMWIFRIGFSFILAKNAGLGVFGVWIAMTIDWLVRAIFFIIRYRGTKWEFKKA